MKILASLILTLCLLVSAALAAPAYEMPTNLSKIDMPEMPEVPEFSVEANGGIYELHVEGIESSDMNHSVLETAGGPGYSWCRLELKWDESRKCFVSEDIMSDEAFANANLSLTWRYNDDTIVGVRAYVADKRLMTASMDVRGEQYNYSYIWHPDMAQVIYDVDDAKNWIDLFQATYSTLNGRPLSYTIYPEDGLSISYTRYGAISRAEFNTSGSYYVWDIDQQCWMCGSEVAETDLSPVTLANYPAPYAEEFAPKRPAATASECDLNAGTMTTRENGVMIYDDTLVVAHYAPNGKLVGYSYKSSDGRKTVSYHANDALSFAMIQTANDYYYYNEDTGWDRTPPEGVNLDDMGPLKAQ